MLLLKTVHIIFLLCRYNECSELAAMQNLGLLSKLQIWKTDILNEEIIIDNQIEITYSILDAINSSQTIQYFQPFNIIKLREIQYKASKALYTSLKCKYSHLIINFLHFFFECISLFENLRQPDSKSDANLELNNQKYEFLNDITKSFIDVKKHVVRMIYNLYNLMWLSTNLKYTNKTLIKSLFSINLCLYHIKIYADKSADKVSGIHSEIDLKKLIVQMITMVERFRCQNCRVKNYYYLNENKKTKIRQVLQNHDDLNNLLKSNIRELEKYDSNLHMDLIYHLKVKSIEFKIEMFDPKYVLLENIFEIENRSIFPKLKVRWENSTLNLYDVYEKVRRSYDIQILFKYQVFLIEVIQNFFYLQFINENSSSSTKGITQLLEAFDDFINKIIPRNYPTNLFDPIKKLRNLLYNDLQSTELTVSLSERSKTLLRKYVIVANIISDNDDFYNVIKKISMKELINNITVLDHFKCFSQFFQLFSYESNTLGDYNLNPVYDFSKIRLHTVNRNMCNDLFVLRENLLLFEMLIVSFNYKNIGCKDDPNDSKVSRAKAQIFAILMHLQNTYIENEEIWQIILPLTIHFGHGHRSLNDYAMIHQVSLLNINLLEHFELNNCVSPRYSLNVYFDLANLYSSTETIKMAKTMEPFPYISLLSAKEKIIEQIEENTKDYRISKTQRMVHSKAVNIFILRLEHYSLNTQDISYSKTFFWDGLMKNMENVYLELSRSVIDYQQLVGIHLFVIKWNVHNVFSSLLKVIQIYDAVKKKQKYEENLKLMKNYLTQFEELQFPKSIKLHLHDIFRAFNSIMFREPSIEENNVSYKSTIIEQLKLLQVYPVNYSYTSSNDTGYIYTIESLINSVQNDIEFLKNFLTSTNKNQLISNIQFSTCIFLRI